MAQINRRPLSENYLRTLQVLMFGVENYMLTKGCYCLQDTSDEVSQDLAEDESAMKIKQPSEGTMVELLRYPNMRRKFYILTFLWLANSVCYNGLSYNSSNLGVSDTLAFFINAIVEAPAYVITWWAMGRWGRRWPVCITMLLGGLACCCCMFVPEGKASITLNNVVVLTF